MYYPNLDEDNSDTTIEFGKFRLNYLSETPSQDYSIRRIECENLQVINIINLEKKIIQKLNKNKRIKKKESFFIVILLIGLILASHNTQQLFLNF